MRRAAKGLGFLAVLGIGVALLPRSARSADPPSPTSEPSAELKDLYLFSDPSDNNRVVFALTTYLNAPSATLFSDHIQYVIHTSATAKFGEHATEKNIVCTFEGTAAPRVATCWFGHDLVARGNADNPAGITSADGELKVFAGRRRNPFFFNRDGYDNALAAYKSIQPAPANAGCGAVDFSGAQNISNALQTTKLGHPANQFAGTTVLALVASLDRSLFTPDTTPYVSAWASTHKGK